MLSAQRIKELLETPEMPDQEAEDVRDALTAFVRKALDQFIYEINNQTYGPRKIEWDKSYSKNGSAFI